MAKAIKVVRDRVAKVLNLAKAIKADLARVKVGRLRIPTAQGGNQVDLPTPIPVVASPLGHKKVSLK